MLFVMVVAVVIDALFFETFVFIIIRLISKSVFSHL